MASPFDIIGNINQSGKSPDMFEDIPCMPSAGSPPGSIEKDYVAFMINRGFSQFGDCCLVANEMNCAPHLPPKMQYHFYRHMITPRRRFSKWAKKNKTEEAVKLIMEAYSYSEHKALAVLPMFDDEGLAVLRKALDKGGKK